MDTKDTLQVGDEVLNGDAETWDADYFKDENANGRFILNTPYFVGYMPMRRKI